MGLFPRLKKRGLIEALLHQSQATRVAGFPRLKKRGLIEAYLLATTNHGDFTISAP